MRLDVRMTLKFCVKFEVVKIKYFRPNFSNYVYKIVLGDSLLGRESRALVKVARTYTRYQIWDVKCIKDGQRIFVKNLDSKGAITINKDNETSLEVMVVGTRMMQVNKLLRERDIQYDVITNDAFSYGGTMSPRLVRSPEGVHRPIRPLPTRNMDWKSFHTLNVVYRFMEDLEKAFPSTCTVSVIGKSFEGKEIKLLKISNSDANNTGIWIDGTTHAREWITTSVVTYIADYIARNFAKLPAYVTNKDWYFLPVVNPDGYNFSHVQDRMWRKNRAHYVNTAVGVDLNRNFSYNWGHIPPHYVCPEVPPTDPLSTTYQGPEPFSEPETTAIKDIILYSRTPFKIFLTFHSCSEVIAFPWCYTNEPCPDYVNLLEGATAMAKAIYETNGRMYKVGGFRDIMYYASGTSIDWSYGVAHIPFSYLVELRSKQDRFLLPPSEIIDCSKEALNGVMALVNFAEQKKCLNCTILSKSHRQ